MGGLFPKAAPGACPWHSFRRYNFLPTMRSDKYLLRGNGLMEIFGAAIGNVVGLAILAIALWELPNFRQHALYSPTRPHYGVRNPWGLGRLPGLLLSVSWIAPTRLGGSIALEAVVESIPIRGDQTRRRRREMDRQNERIGFRDGR
jgi:hypothetical protein